MTLEVTHTVTNASIPCTIDFTFDWLDEGDISIYKDGGVSAMPRNQWRYVTRQQVEILAGNFVVGSVFKLLRETQVSTPAVTYVPGAAIRAQDLNDNHTQVRNVTEELSERAVRGTGGTMTGNLDMTTNRIINLGDGIANGDAVNKLQLDTVAGINSAASIAAQAAQAAAATSEANAAASATAAASSATASANSATASANSATGASTSEANAQTHANTATTQATNAATSASNAATSETNAATSAGNAQSSANAAQSSANAAAASLANFVDHYLGNSATEPTTDTDGSALEAGDLFYRTTAPVGMHVWTGTQWLLAFTNAIASGITSTAAGDIVATNVQAALEELDTEKVPRTATTGSAKLPVGTDAQRDGSPQTGYFRYNTDQTSFEGYDGTQWGPIGGGGGATGGGTDKVFILHEQTVTTDFSIPVGQNAISAAPVTVNAGVVVTTPPGSNWTIV